MLGAIVLSEYNDVVHTFGNAEFRRCIASKKLSETSTLCSQQKVARLRPPNDEDSASLSSSSATTTTTSGVASRSDSFATNSVGENRAPTTSRMNGVRKRAQASKSCGTAMSISKYDIDRNCLLEKILPLVVIYRINQEQPSPAIDETANCVAKPPDLCSSCSSSSSTSTSSEFKLAVESRNLKFRITDYENSFIIVFICDENCCDATLKMFRDVVNRCLDFHYGPIISLLETGYAGLLAQIQSRAERRSDRLIRGFPKLYNDVFSQNLTFGSAKYVENLMHLVREMTSKIAQTLERKCRCIVVNCGQIIGSTCSDEKAPPLFDAFHVDEISSLLEFALQEAELRSEQSSSLSPADETPDNGFKCQVEQAWLYSKLLGRRQYVNVHAFSITSDIELICLSNAHFAPLIMALSDAERCLTARVESLIQRRERSDSRLGSIKLRAAHSDRNSQNATLNVLKWQQDCFKANAEAERIFKEVFFKLQDFKMSESIGSLGNSSKAMDYISKYVYLNNMERTQKLIKNQWHRLCIQFANYLQQQEKLANSDTNRRASIDSYYYNSFPASMRLSLAQLGSSFSLISNNSSNCSAADNGVYSTVHSANTSGFRSSTSRSAERKYLHAWNQSAAPSLSQQRSRASGASNSLTIVSEHHLNAMLTQLRRVMRGLLKELMEHSYFVVKSLRLNSLHACVRQSVDRRLAGRLSDLSNDWKTNSPLQPLRLGLDILAYRINRTDVPFNYHFIPSEYRSIFSKFDATKLESDFIIARSEEGQLFTFVSKTEEPICAETIWKRFRLTSIINKSMKGKSPLTGDAELIAKSTRTTICAAIFPDCVNTALAIRQSYQLIATFDAHIDEIVKNIH